jgi:hypothetical protein
MKHLIKCKLEEPLVPVDNKGTVLSVPKHDKLDTVNGRVTAVQYCVTYPSVPAMIKELREIMRDHVARYTDHVSTYVDECRETTSQHIYPTISLRSRAVRTRRVHEHDGFMV